MRATQIVSDIGGTYARMGVYNPVQQSLEYVQKLEVAEFETFELGLQHYIDSLSVLSNDEVLIEGICVAAAGPLTQDLVFNFLNNHWQINASQVALNFNCRFELINDFSAQALGVGVLSEADSILIQDGDKASARFDSQLKLCIGPGTGFGAGGILPDGSVLTSEAGHMSFAPLNDQEYQILSNLQRRYPRVSIERLISGSGLVNIALALSQSSDYSQVDGNVEKIDSARQVVELAQQGDQLCLAAIEQFFKTFADVAGDLCLVWCAPTVYLCGGVLPRLLDFLDVDEFCEHFANKGRYGELCRGVNIKLVTNDMVGLYGCGVSLNKS